MLTRPILTTGHAGASLLTLSIVLAAAGCALPANGEGDAAQRAKTECAPGTAQGKSPAGLEQITLCAQTATKKHEFTVEVARSPIEQARGLMFRTALADGRGMLFPYNQPRILSFWMKNTVIPLDIIFIRADGSIESIAANTTPYSLEAVTSGEPAAAALEIRAGLSAELGIKPDDKIIWTK